MFFLSSQAFPPAIFWYPEAALKCSSHEYILTPYGLHTQLFHGILHPACPALLHAAPAHAPPVLSWGKSSQALVAKHSLGNYLLHGLQQLKCEQVQRLYWTCCQMLITPTVHSFNSSVLGVSPVERGNVSHPSYKIQTFWSRQMAPVWVRNNKVLLACFSSLERRLAFYVFVFIFSCSSCVVCNRMYFKTKQANLKNITTKRFIIATVTFHHREKKDTCQCAVMKYDQRRGVSTA